MMNLKQFNILKGSIFKNFSEIELIIYSHLEQKKHEVFYEYTSNIIKWIYC
jgi:hypothetical protein